MTYSSFDEYLATPQFRSVRAAVLERDNRRCTVCGEAATEVHHVRYCKWGEFDTEDNLVSICHGCHCDLHRCRNCGEVKLKAKHIKHSLKVCDGCTT